VGRLGDLLALPLDLQAGIALAAGLIPVRLVIPNSLPIPCHPELRVRE
jgi:hypothetical protein